MVVGGKKKRKWTGPSSLLLLQISSRRHDFYESQAHGMACLISDSMFQK